MKKLLFVLLLASSSALASSMSLMTDQLAAKAIFTRVGIGNACKFGMEYQSVAGAQLELAYDNALASLDKSDLTVKNWQSLNPEKCLSTCTCSALSRIYAKYPENIQKQISNKTIEKNLLTMTDEDYTRCMKKQKNFCNRADIKVFMKNIRNAL